jgi:excisionase family DNA binding protein
MERSTLTVKEAAQYIGVSQDTMYTMVREDEVPHVRVRRRILFRKASLDDWMTKQESGQETTQGSGSSNERPKPRLIMSNP